MSDPSELNISTPDGSSYFSLSKVEAKSKYRSGEIAPTQHVWSPSSNAWVPAGDFFTNLKETSKISINTVRLSAESIKKKASAHRLSAKLRKKPSQDTQSVPIETESKSVFTKAYDKVIDLLS